MDNASKWNTNAFTSKVELSISCQNLRDTDILSKSDPQVIVFLKDSYQGSFIEIGSTEVIKDNRNPEFVKKIPLDYNFESVQYLKFEVWDIDIGERDFLGRHETTLAEVVSSKGAEYRRGLTGVPNRDCGVIKIIVEEVSACNHLVELQFRGHDLKKGFLCKPSPFLSIWRSNEGGSFSVVYKTEYRSNSTNPSWQMIKTSVGNLCNGDFDRNLRIDCMGHKSSGDHKLIGSFQVTLNDLLKHDKSQPLKLWNEKKNSDAGLIHLLNVRIIERFSFLDYIRGGTQLHFVVAVDFTASNGDVSNPDSLHYIDPTNARPNQYEIALRSIGEIVQYYDHSGFFAGFGFGAKIPPNGQVSHEFPLNGNPEHPYCNGVEDLVACYRRAITGVTLYGPTNFAPIINNTARIASQYQTGSNYFILLIITDGIISDMTQTMKAIISASSLPVSIIIVGVGSADFTAMDQLDSDDKLLKVENMKAVRDIVQFVPLNKYLNGSRTVFVSKAQLAKDVLLEIPDQVVNYMTFKGFKPTNK